MTSPGPKHLSTYLYQSRSIILEMLEYRGFEVEKYKNFTTQEMSILSELKETNTPEPIIVKAKNHEIQVHYILDKKTPSFKNISTLVDKILESRSFDGELTVIIITNGKYSQTVHEGILELNRTNGLHVQVFPIKTLMFNVTKHKCVPLHERLESSMEIDRIKESYHLESLEQLPQIMDTDPVAKFIGLRPGDVCKITRPSLSSGKHIVYRHCIGGSI